MIDHSRLPAWLKTELERNGFTDVRRKLYTGGQLAGVTVVKGTFPRGAGLEGCVLRAEMRRRLDGEWMFLLAMVTEHDGLKIRRKWQSGELRDFVAAMLP